MSLTGVDPNDPRVATRREFIFAVGKSAGGAGARSVLLYGNKTAAGSETVNKIGLVINGDADMIARAGRRSELQWLRKMFVAIDSSADMYMIAVPEGAGTAASCTLTFVTPATAVGTVEITLLGEKIEIAVAVGAAIADVATAVALAINGADEGGWPVTASAALGVVTVTCANLGPRGDFVIGNASDRGLRARMTTVTGMTVTKSALTAGTVEDDFTAAYAEASNGEYYWQVNPKHAAATVTSTDNGIGEGLEYIKGQALPAVGKAQFMCVGHVGTQATATAIAISAAANTVYGHLFHAEDSDWTPGMIASHSCAALRVSNLRHPAMPGINGYTSTDNTTFQIPDPYNKDDRPTATEVIADLNNGVTPIEFSANGRSSIGRFVTTRSLNPQGSNDYRSRSGHIPHVLAFVWEIISQRWAEQKQPFVAEDPAKGKKPTAKTSTPGQLKSLIWGVIDDLASSNPLGKYDGPILAPDAVAEMKASTITRKAGPGALGAICDFKVVEHLIKSETELRETSPAY